MECRTLKEILFKYGITYSKMAENIGISTTSFCAKINNGTFWQDEMISIVLSLQNHDRSVDLNIFLPKNLNNIQV